MSQAVIHKFSYRGQEYSEVECEIIKEPKYGAKGWFVNIEAPQIFDNPVRVRLKDPTEDITYKTTGAPVQAQNNQESDETIIERIKDRFEVFEHLAQAIAKDSIRALIVSGRAGIGKTETIRRQFESMNLREDHDYTVIRGSIVSGFQLYQLLYDNRGSDSVLILDDCDHILKDSNALNILKAALESGSRSRKISYKSKALEDNGIPTEFEFEGRIIFITNEDFHDKVEQDRGNYAKHLAALIDRSLYLDLMLRSSREVYCRIKQVIQEHDMLGYHDVDSEYYGVILDWINNNKDRLATLSLRTPSHLADVIVANPEQWEKIARVTLISQKR